MKAMRRYTTRQPDFDARLSELLAFDTAQDPAIDAAVAAILADVKKRGDAAVLEYTQRYDRVTAGSVAQLEIAQADMQRALNGLPAAQRDALEAAANRVRAYHDQQRAQSWTYCDSDGNELGPRLEAAGFRLQDLQITAMEPLEHAA